MSVVYGEGLDRVPLGAIANGKGIGNKAVDIVCVTTASNPVSVVALGGRRWITASNPTASQEQPQIGTCYLRIAPNGLPIDETRRATPGMPPLTGVRRIIVSWKVAWNGQAINTGNGNYFVSVGGTVLSFSVPTNGDIVMTGKGYFPCELVFNRDTRVAELYINGVRQSSRTGVVGDEIRLGLLGLLVIPGGVMKGGQSWLTDIVVVYDDGIAPCSRIGDVRAASTAVDFVEPRHADVVATAGDITTSELNAATPSVQLVGDGCVDVYAPEETQPILGTGTILAVLVDERRQADSPIAGDLETKIETTLGSTVKLERPTTLLPSLQFAIRAFTKPITLKAYKEEVKFKVTAKSR